jgi:cytochrome P450
MYLNGLEHKQIRTLLGRAFKSLNVSGIVEQALEEHLQKYDAQETIDLVDFSAHFIYKVVQQFFGADKDKTLAEIKKYSNLLARSQDYFVPKPVYQQINEQFLWGRHIFDHSPFQQLIKKLAEEADHSLTEDEVYSVMSVILMASFETSKDNLVVTLYEILKRPALLQYALQANPAQLPVLIEELIRFSAPLQYTVRTTTSAIEIAGIEIPANSKLLLCLASANRDPNAFSDPNEIMADRTPNEHLSFGFGLHFCLGALIARQELRMCLQPMLQLLQKYQVSEAPPLWARQMMMRTMESAIIRRKPA